MADGVRVDVDSLPRLRAALRRVNDRELWDELKDASRQAGNTVRLAAWAGAPVRTGALVRTVRSGALRNGAVVRAGNGRVPYAGPIHWGWPARGIVANPFVTEAAQATEPVWVSTYLDRLKRIISQIEESGSA